MTRLTLRKGFTLRPAPEGAGQLTDSLTGDALVVPPADFALLEPVGLAGLESTAPGLDEVLARYSPFFVELHAASDSAPGFYELDIEDAPTAVNLPRLVPAAVASRVDRSAATTLSNVSTAELEARAALVKLAFEEETMKHFPTEEGAENTAPGDEAEPSSEVSRQQAHESHPTEQLTREAVKAIIAEASVPPAAAPAPVAPRPSRAPVVLTLIGVMLLGLGVAATFALRPAGEPPLPEPLRHPTVVVVLDASTPTPVAVAAAVDAGGPWPEERPVDAGAALPVALAIDAGPPAEPEPEPGWLAADVQARGRVKMGDVLAAADGEVSWTVVDAQRVKAKQALGSVGNQPLSASSVGLVMIKQSAGAAVRRGAVVAEIIYFEAWAKGLVKGATPTTAWRCEVSSASAQQKASCKISVVAPKGNGAMVTVAIEPRWFDGATDAVMRLAP